MTPIKVVTKTIDAAELDEVSSGYVQIVEDIQAPLGYQVISGGWATALDDPLPIWGQGVVTNANEYGETVTEYNFATFAFPKPAPGTGDVYLTIVCIPSLDVEAVSYGAHH